MSWETVTIIQMKVGGGLVQGCCGGDSGRMWLESVSVFECNAGRIC